MNKKIITLLVGLSAAQMATAATEINVVDLNFRVAHADPQHEKTHFEARIPNINEIFNVKGGDEQFVKYEKPALTPETKASLQAKGFDFIVGQEVSPEFLDGYGHDVTFNDHEKAQCVNVSNSTDISTIPATKNCLAFYKNGENIKLVTLFENSKWKLDSVHVRHIGWDYKNKDNAYDRNYDNPYQRHAAVAEFENRNNPAQKVAVINVHGPRNVSEGSGDNDGGSKAYWDATHDRYGDHKGLKELVTSIRDTGVPVILMGDINVPLIRYVGYESDFRRIMDAVLKPSGEDELGKGDFGYSHKFSNSWSRNSAKDGIFYTSAETSELTPVDTKVIHFPSQESEDTFPCFDKACNFPKHSPYLSDHHGVLARFTLSDPTPIKTCPKPELLSTSYYNGTVHMHWALPPHEHPVQSYQLLNWQHQPMPHTLQVVTQPDGTMNADFPDALPHDNSDYGYYLVAHCEASVGTAEASVGVHYPKCVAPKNPQISYSKAKGKTTIFWNNVTPHLTVDDFMLYDWEGNPMEAGKDGVSITPGTITQTGVGYSPALLYYVAERCANGVAISSRAPVLKPDDGRGNQCPAPIVAYTKDADGTVHLSWNKLNPNDNNEGFNIYRADGSWIDGSYTIGTTYTGKYRTDYYVRRYCGSHGNKSRKQKVVIDQ